MVFVAETVIRDVVAQLAAARYADLERRTHGVRLSARELAGAVRDYGRRIIPSPDGAELLVDVVPITAAEPPAWSVNVPLEVWPDRVVATFPPIPVDSLGCPDDYAPGSDSRRYFWQLGLALPDSRYPDNHFMLAGVELAAPSRLVMRHAMLDSLLRKGRYYADEAAGEPPMPIRDLKPESNHVRWDPDHSQAVLTLEGRAAVEAIFRTRPEKASLGWCTRSGYGNATMSVNYR